MESPEELLRTELAALREAATNAGTGNLAELIRRIDRCEATLAEMTRPKEPCYFTDPDHVPDDLYVRIRAQNISHNHHAGDHFDLISVDDAAEHKFARYFIREGRVFYLAKRIVETDLKIRDAVCEIAKREAREQGFDGVLVDEKNWRITITSKSLHGSPSSRDADYRIEALAVFYRLKNRG